MTGNESNGDQDPDTGVQILDSLGGVIMTTSEWIRAGLSDRARRRFFDQGEMPLGEVPVPVLRSWQRCVEAGQEADRPVGFEQISRSRIREVEESGHELVRAANAEMLHLAHTVSDAKLIVVLADACGTVIETVGNFSSVSPRLNLAARKGVDFSESSIGTNAIGTAIMERSPVAVIAHEHYFKSNNVHTCVAAPLFAPDGSVKGVLDVSGDFQTERPDFFDVVVTSALAIENRMLYEMQGAIALSFSPRAELLGTPWEAIIAFDSGGRVIGRNATAQRLLALKDRSYPAKFDELFGLTFREALRYLGKPERSWSLQSMTGLRVSACLREIGKVRSGRPASSRAAVSESGRARGHSDSSASALRFLEVVCKDNATRKAVERAQRAYDRGVPTLLVGETGTGKELVARALHLSGSRSDKPFVAVNCASYPETLIEAELFGYADGAFTGARKGGAQGKLEQANCGTLLLDEIGDMPMASQAKLLRVLQERCVVRLGENRERPIDVALICATHQDLPLLIADRLFREDLYYRINGLRITLPPLRERNNILEVVRYLLEQQGFRGDDLSEGALQLLLGHPWPGNLRQLGHVIASTVALVGDGHRIESEHFPEDFLGQGAVGSSAENRTGSPFVSLDQAETELIERTLRACNGNVSATARRLGVSRSTLYNKMKRR
jgi:transcriptional regulator of acetoin/glycerol metabolism